MKTIDEIYGEMLARFQSETGMEASGSGDLAVRLYAVAAQVYALYVQEDWVARQCFPQTAAGEYLDLHAELRGVTRREAVCAQGVLRFQTDEAATADWEIPAGTVCMTAGLVRFETEETGVIRTGETSTDIPARAVEPGLGGNVAAGSIVTMSVPPVGVSRCINPDPFTGGLDAEDDEELRERVLETYKRLPNGANAAYYRQEAMSFEEVVEAVVIPRARGIGTVDVVVATAAGTPDSELLEALTVYFEERREIAVDVSVLAPEIKTVDVTVRVAPQEGVAAQDAVAAAEEAIRNAFDGRMLGKSVLRAGLGNLAFEAEGVANCAVDLPAADVTAEPKVLPVLGTLTVTAMEG